MHLAQFLSQLKLLFLTNIGTFYDITIVFTLSFISGFSRDFVLRSGSSFNVSIYSPVTPCRSINLVLCPLQNLRFNPSSKVILQDRPSTVFFFFFFGCMLVLGFIMSELSNRQMIVRTVFQIVTVKVLLKTCFAKDVIPASFVFGDSLVDAGNNNYVASLSKANFVPNGIDFGGPTGRFTNGRTIVDIIGKLIKLLHACL